MVAQSDFHQNRLKGIGGSDLTDVFQLEWGCARRLYYQKTDQAPDFTTEQKEEENYHIRRGKLLEPIIVDLYERETGRWTRVKEHQQHPQYQWLIGHVDRLQLDPTKPEMGLGVLECKCPGEKNFDAYSRDGLPTNYQLQLQHYLLLTGLSWGTFAVFNSERMELQVSDVAIDPGIQGEILRRGELFWGCVNDRNPPNALEPTDARCANCRFRITCQGDKVKPALVDQELGPYVSDYKQTKIQLELAEKNHDISKHLLQQAVGYRPHVKCDEGSVKWVTTNRKSIPIKDLREKYPDVAEKLEKVSTSKYLRVD